MKSCNPNMHMGREKECSCFEHHCFSEWADGTKGHWGHCTKLNKTFRYIIGTTPPCEPIQATLM